MRNLLFWLSLATSQCPHITDCHADSRSYLGLSLEANLVWRRLQAECVQTRLHVTPTPKWIRINGDAVWFALERKCGYNGDRQSKKQHFYFASSKMI